MMKKTGRELGVRTSVNSAVSGDGEYYMLAKHAQLKPFSRCGAVFIAGLVSLASSVLAQSPQLGLPDAEGMGTPFQEQTLRSLVRNHGDFLDEKHMFIVEEEDGIVTFKLRKNERAPGGPHLFYDPDTGEEESVIRFQAEENLARVRSEVLVVAPPNYVKNPGQRYRITVEGLGIAPDYARVFEVDAYDAIDAVYAEIARMLSDTYGIQREALFYGLQVGLQWLNEDQRFPAAVPLPVLRSEAGQRRIQGQYLERSRGPGSRNLQSIAQGGAGEMRWVWDDDSSSRRLMTGSEDEPAPSVRGGKTPAGSLSAPGGQAPAYRRGRPGIVERGQAPQLRQYRGSREDLMPADPRAQRMRGLRDPQPRREKPGLPGRPLTVPEQPYPAIDAANVENLEITSGEMDSPLTLKSRGNP